MRKVKPVEESRMGRPPIFSSPIELQAKITEYFESGVNKRKVEVGKPPNNQVIEIPVPTISGLCYFLGFESRQSFFDYQRRPDFSYTIKRARLFIERTYEEQLQLGNVAGAIFALKNFDWSDKQELGFTDKQGNDLTFNIVVPDQSTANSIKKFRKDGK